MSRLLAVLLLAATAAAAEPPLPDGAVARLGSARSRATGYPTAAEFSADGKHLAVSDSQTVAIFDATTGELRHLLPVPDKQYPHLIRFLADGKRVAVGSRDGQRSGQVAIFNVADGKPDGIYKLSAERQLHLADIYADGTRLLAVDWFTKVYLWDLPAGRDVWSFPHERAMYVQPVGTAREHFVMSGGNQPPELRETATGKLVGKYPDPGPRFNQRHQLGVSADGRVALGSEKGDAIVVLDTRGGNRVRTFTSNRWHQRFAFSPDGRYLSAPTSVDTPVWDLTAADGAGPVARLPAATAGVFSPDGKTLVLNDEGALTFWSVGPRKQLPQSADPPSPVHRVWFTGDGQRVIGYTRQGWVSWPAVGGPTTRVSDDGPGSNPEATDVTPDGRVAADLVFVDSPKGDGRIDSMAKQSIRVTDLTTGKVRRIPFAIPYWGGLRISPNGRCVSAVDGGMNYVVWDVATGSEVSRSPRPGNQSVVFGALLTADGKQIAASVVGEFNDNPGARLDGPMYKSVTLVDHRTDRRTAMDPMPWSVYSGGARFGRDPSRFVLAGRFEGGWEKMDVSVWDVASGRRLINWRQESGRLASVVLAPDNRSLLTGTTKGMLSVVEVATGGERRSFRHRGQVWSAAFHPDGSKAVSSSPDAPVYVWDLIGRPGSWNASRVHAVWADLLSPDAKVAYAAIRTLRANPVAAVAFLKDRVKLPAPPDDETLSKWLKGLDAPAFAERERAQRELTAVADLVRPKLEAARKGATEEAGRRLDQVLKASEELSPANLRRVRACEVLEGIGTAEAMAVLQVWSAGPAGARLTIEASESASRKRP